MPSRSSPPHRRRPEHHLPAGLPARPFPHRAAPPPAPRGGRFWTSRRPVRSRRWDGTKGRSTHLTARTARVAPGGVILHVLSRGDARSRVFGSGGDSAAFFRGRNDRGSRGTDPVAPRRRMIGGIALAAAH